MSILQRSLKYHFHKLHLGWHKREGWTTSRVSHLLVCILEIVVSIEEDTIHADESVVIVPSYALNCESSLQIRFSALALDLLKDVQSVWIQIFEKLNF